MTRQPVNTGGDDLDDGLELDATLLASDDEDQFGSDVDVDAEGMDGAEFLSDDEDEAPAPRASKRKAEAVDGDDDDNAVSTGDATADAAARKKLRKEKEKARKAAKVSRSGPRKSNVMGY